ncbi:ligase-associated DNA damage response endonuclease PdeM [Dongia deserti]|uniref:ligase-associated DNA damage response endonuclease PdeM n=1 Tax=Dongia deserti TaxID=2268030 RepID=UPI000E64E63D|nr:ligase-associated DNA damage response endonuclease PdeM [Dongia deserti]
MKHSITITWHGIALQLDLEGVLYWPEEQLLVAADLHLEKGSSYARSAGRLLPPYDSAQTVARLERLVAHYQPQCVVALGDSFHDRAGATRLDGEVADRIRRLSDRTDWIWIHGNHDPKPPKQLGGRGAVEIAIGPLVFRHDAHHERQGEGGEIIGHYHPVASVSTRGRSFRRRCFAIGRHRLLLPAFGAYAGGLNVREVAIRRLLDAEARLALLGRDRLHLFPIAAALPDATLPL